MSTPDQTDLAAQVAAQASPAQQPQPPAPDPASDVEQLRAQVAALQKLVEQQQQQAAPRTTAAGGTLGIPEPPEGMPDFAAEWPAEGGLTVANGDQAPQPFDLKSHGFRVGNANDGETTVMAPHSGTVDVLAPGAPDHVSPIVPIHGRPLLGPLTADPSVFELGALLAELGIETSVSQGTNPNGVFDESMINGVERFREAYHVEEDPSQWPTRGAENARVHCGAWTWEAIFRAVAHQRAAAGDDRRAIAH